ncbi:MAG: transporter substrate-binding domain-containing protein [Candidatus Accumulibacter sp.]|uniref:substrate-binding periplasmic protein n=1 Tax=Accumulibacter sp. TaxID=2053492 RepID=UPI00287ACDF3|nr:transporter substrate-binding domain-containing protein [Accumulibacter sp.]MDS4014598.1 transporter substrate-binding domain-containing protein [Accumulibacter sp.]
MMCAWRLLAGLALLLYLNNGLAETLARLTAVHALIPPLAGTADGSGFLERVVREAFRRAGMALDIQAIPAERALINVNTGVDDLDLSRASGFEQQYPNLVRVPEKTMDFEFVAFVPASSTPFPTDHWNSLRDHTVAYVTGWKIFERNVGQTRETVRAPSIPSLFEILKQNRAEAVLLERWQGLHAARDAGVKVHVLEPPLARAEMFIYLNKRHSERIPALVAALQQMKADGSYQRIMRETLTATPREKADR